MPTYLHDSCREGRIFLCVIVIVLKFSIKHDKIAFVKIWRSPLVRLYSQSVTSRRYYMIETMTKRVDIGVQNKERIISDVLKDESYRSLNRVKKIDNNTLEIEFSEQDFRFKEKRKVVIAPSTNGK